MGSCTRAAAVSPPSAVRSTSIVPWPPSATGHRSGGRRPADSRPRPIAAATSVARNVPLNPSGATSTGRSVRSTLLIELVDRAGLRRLVVAPALDLGAVANAAVGDVVEGDLDHELGAQRDPPQVAAVRPA